MEMPVIYESENREALTLVEQANALRVVDKASFDEAGEKSLAIARFKKSILGYFKPLEDAAKKNLQEIRTKKDMAVKPLEDAADLLAMARGGWKMEQDRLQRIEQQRLEKEANEKAEKERPKLLDKIDTAKTPKKAQELFEKAEQVYAQPVFAEKHIQKTTKMEN